MKVAVLWTSLSGYLNACLKELAGREGVELLVYHKAPSREAPYDVSQFAWMSRRVMWRSVAELDPLDGQLREFGPDLILVAGWHVQAYRRAAQAWKGRSWRVMTMDNAWHGTVKQWLGVLTAPIHLRPIADAVWLPGERQAVFARKLGFPAERVLRGLYSCDLPRFAQAHTERVAAQRPTPRAFLFVGRFVETKGIALLAESYRRYRAETTDPWPLICCGTGPQGTLLEHQPGIQVEGFVQPERMPSKLATAGCFILPSIFEPWALALHEAAAAGLILLASESVGASVHLLQPNFNGFLFGAGDAEALANLMTRVSQLSDERREAMSRASFLLAQQYTPERWANTLVDEYQARRGALASRQ